MTMPVVINPATTTTPQGRRLVGDIAIMGFTGILAGCGLVYEYLLANTAGRILGAVESVIFAMIGVMIVAMGLGAFLARCIRNPFGGFAWLEVALAVLGGTSVLVLGAATAIGELLPHAIAETYGMPQDLAPEGGAVAAVQQAAAFLPYVMGAALGILVGMEIPLLARIRETLHRRRLVHNAGSIYGADYIGAGAGAAVWVAFMLSLEPAVAAVWTAGVNLAIGFAFIALFAGRIAGIGRIFTIHVCAAALLALLAWFGADWSRGMETVLYQDRVIHRVATRHQRLTVTERLLGSGRAVHSFFINGRLQFSSEDEHIYHAMLTYPPMAAAARHDRVLVIGGGDGLALRDILRWNPHKVVLLDLDRELVSLFAKPVTENGRIVNRPLLELNRFAFADPRVSVRYGDAFLSVDALIREARRFDVIIVDLPDPSHPDLNRLYSLRFYAKLRQLLAGDGAMSVQSTSPYHAAAAFLSIGKTIAAAGFRNVEQYRQNVPSFGEWGWTIATARGRPVSRRLRAMESLPVDDGWTTREILVGSFAFPKGFHDGLGHVVVNRIGNAAVYRYYRESWREVAAGREAAETGLLPSPARPH